jgi:hypothetical protein
MNLWQMHIVSECSEVELNLRPKVSQPVRLGGGPPFGPFGAHDQILHVL